MKLKGKIVAILVLLIAALCGCVSQKESEYVYKSEGLQIKRLNKNVYLHTSFLELENGYKFPCNGLIYSVGDSTVVLDTPVDDASSIELINWLQIEQQQFIKGVVISHSHNDASGALNAFHKRGIESYGNQRTTELLLDKGLPQPTHIFDFYNSLQLSDKSIFTEHVGHAHSSDNTYTYLPDEKLLFGSCIVKELGAGKGNLTDANIEHWPDVIRTLQRKEFAYDMVVPGHGKAGGRELLHYTKEMFNPYPVTSDSLIGFFTSDRKSNSSIDYVFNSNGRFEISNKNPDCGMVYISSGSFKVNEQNLTLNYDYGLDLDSIFNQQYIKLIDKTKSNSNKSEITLSFRDNSDSYYFIEPPKVRINDSLYFDQEFVFDDLKLFPKNTNCKHFRIEIFYTKSHTVKITLDSSYNYTLEAVLENPMNYPEEEYKYKLNNDRLTLTPIKPKGRSFKLYRF